MNNISTLHTEYLRASRTIDIVLVSKGSLSKICYVYNYEGYSFRLFSAFMNMLDFFKDENTESDFYFNSEEELDEFLLEMKL